MVNSNSEIINNMIIHYSGLMKVGTRNFGGDFMSESIFHDIDTNADGKLSQREINIAKPKLKTFIEKVLNEDDFYAQLYFGKEYTNNLLNINRTSRKSASKQIVQNNLNRAIYMIMTYAASHPDDNIIKQYAAKLSEIIANNNLKLTDIDTSGVVGQARKVNGFDEILIDDHDSISNLSVNELLKTLLHELRHTLETDNINSKAEELEAETTARILQEKISGVKIFNNSIETFLIPYCGYAEASPGTYSIPQNTGIAVWYKPVEVKMNNNNELVIKSDIQKTLNNVYIEDHVYFGTKRSEDNNQYPVSAKCIIKDKDGNILYEYDYGEYNIETKSFDYHKVHIQQIELSMSKTSFGL